MKLERLKTARKILLYGYGAEGRSSEAWLKEQCPEAQVEIHEDQPSSSSSQREERKIEWEDYDVIVKSPGVPPRSIPVEHHGRMTSNLRLLLENLSSAQRQKLIGVTGSKGKSTTVKFCHELLQKAGFRSAIIGNYGVPALEIWQQLDELNYIVAECSSFQLWDVPVSPHYAIFLSFFADHLDWHNGSEAEYFTAKANLWAHQQSGDFLFVPKETSQTLLEKEGLKVSLFKGDLEGLTETELVPADLFPPESTLQAAHFRQNLGPVWALAEQLQLENLAVLWQQTAAEFTMIEHRLELFCERDGFTYFNDSIATSPDATIKAVEWLEAGLSVLILDGQDTGVASCEALVQTLKNKAPQARVAVVESDIATAFSQAAQGTDLAVESFNNYPDLLAWIQAETVSGAVLFSPGGKSFNRFKNYAERGMFFKELVRNIPPLVGEV